MHTWSLAVEEQYYVLFPAFMVLVWRLGGKIILSLFLLLLFLSFCLSLWASAHMPLAAFYLLPMRGWEILVGAVCSYVLFYHREYLPQGRYFTQGAAFAGLAMIIVGVFAYRESYIFPGLYALLPTLGTALIILFATPETVVNKLLAQKICVGIGLVSYSAYLWHQPLFAYYKILSFGKPDDLGFLALVILSFVLAYVSWRFVENPFRDRNLITIKPLLIFSIAGALFFIVAGTVIYINKGFPDRFHLPLSFEKTFERSARQKECFGLPYRNEGDEWYCDIGDMQSNASFAVIGDSHALSLLDGFNQVAQASGRRGIFAGYPGCVPFLKIHALRDDQKEKNCHDLNTRMLQEILNRGLDTVFLVARWSYYTDGGYEGDNFSYISLKPAEDKTKAVSRHAFEAGLEETVHTYHKYGVRVVLLQQVPEQKGDPKALFYRVFQKQNIKNEALEHKIRASSVSVEEHLNLQEYVRGLFEIYKNEGMLDILSFDEVFCDDLICVLGSPKASYYYDEDHLSVSGAFQTLPEIQKAFDRR